MAEELLAAVPRQRGTGATILHEVTEAEGYIASICFKTGPPALVGTELEWTVHHEDAPGDPLDPALLRRTLGPHAPPTLAPEAPHQPLPGGGIVTLEPGGQVEISSAPAASLTALRQSVDRDRTHLIQLLAAAGLRLGESGIDPHRHPRRLLDTPRYAAMQRAFDSHSDHGRTMMCSTAGLQVCVDAGEPHRLVRRWAAVHALGPVLLATFATARRHAGRDSGWASARMRAWLGIDHRRSGPVGRATDPAVDPATAWARYALTAPLLCVRRPGPRWDAPPGVTFADWIAGALTPPPTTEDLDYHLGTLFPPIRPRGYLELRFLDTQPADEWFAPVAVVSALLDDDRALDAARAACEPVEGRWLDAARLGLSDPALATAAARVCEEASRALDRTDLPAADRAAVLDILDRRLPGRRRA
ncbi:ergothioneine biosynthesis glutamate--cysteine ligase EgtA [Planosporangium flavigriseum]|uniref:Glutamate--cysteine ligase EgtA n=1 Tax=Planosporangium flavigriseum TaxID=373681 RepID=A0A8J3LS78_9ACTN|nr:ergothioneine biosynthesis glutamate--cysteine ligase EgtA [Planosporangium flavigriseum]NJC67679.1 ergothioneine biosynthesis glutamate--cysteine ligase EgtA [Planosporangium flavigriseum]GIG75845.1 glutamate--cysteine ligase EgtA [Planosporangium flavigriseum]